MTCYKQFRGFYIAVVQAASCHTIKKLSLMSTKNIILKNNQAQATQHTIFINASYDICRLHFLVYLFIWRLIDVFIWLHINKGIQIKSEFGCLHTNSCTRNGKNRWINEIFSKKNLHWPHFFKNLLQHSLIDVRA